MIRYPNLFLVGAPKCGTTSLAYYLSQHPEIFLPATKEPTYFVKDFTRRQPQQQTEADYLSLYNQWNNERYAMNASTSYFFSRTAAHDIAARRPDAKILVMIRNPIDAVYSMYFENMFSGIEDAPIFEDALQIEEKRVESGIPPRNGALEYLLYSRIFSFFDNIMQFGNAFGSERVCVLVLDDLKRDARREMARVLEHLGLDPGFADRIDYTLQNSAKRPLSRHMARLAVYPPAWVGRFTRPFLTQEQRVRIRTAVRRINVVPREYPPMLPETRRRLAAQWAPEVRRLSDLLDRDLSCWLKCDG